MQTQPFQIAIADHDIDDLRRRIRATRWAPATPSPAWQQGPDSAWLRELASYWAEHFDWRAAERGLNRFCRDKEIEANKNRHAEDCLYS